MGALTIKDKREIRETVLAALEEFRAKEQAQADQPIRAEEVSALTGWTLKTIYSYKKKLKGWSCGTTLFFSRRFILDYIEQNKPVELKLSTI